MGRQDDMMELSWECGCGCWWGALVEVAVDMFKFIYAADSLRTWWVCELGEMCLRLERREEKTKFGRNSEKRRGRIYGERQVRDFLIGQSKSETWRSGRGGKWRRESVLVSLFVREARNCELKWLTKHTSIVHLFIFSSLFNKMYCFWLQSFGHLWITILFHAIKRGHNATVARRTSQ